MTLLQIVQEFCGRTGITIPSVITLSSDDQVLQIKGLLNEVLDSLTNRKTSNYLKEEALFNTVAAESQGSMSTLASEGYMDKIIGGFLVNRSTKEIILGPVTPEEWQAKNAGIYSISSISYRLRGGNLYFSPAPAAGQQISFEYKSKNAVVASDSTRKQYFTADSDTCLFPDDILILGLRWAWKREKGLRYMEEQRLFEERVANFLSDNEAPRTINLAEERTVEPGVNVPERSWSL